MAETSEITVLGMTCEHCVNRVSGELSELPGVSDVRIDLASGRVTISSAGVLSDDAVRDAVEEAGYELAGA